MLTIMGGIAEFERGLIRKHTDEGIERARKQDKKFGRPERLDAVRSGSLPTVTAMRRRSQYGSAPSGARFNPPKPQRPKR
jgi:DNA invertase Pin-like site-specific DNA recombinase